MSDWVQVSDRTYINLDHIASLRKEDAGHYKMTNAAGLTRSISGEDGEAIAEGIRKRIKRATPKDPTPSRTGQGAKSPNTKSAK